jgi:hypothetical protein
MARRGLYRYSIDELKIWDRFEKLVLLMNSPNGPEARAAYAKAKKLLADRKLRWNDCPRMNADTIKGHFPRSEWQRGKWRDHIWRGRELDDWFRPDENLDWESIVSVLRANGGSAHLQRLYESELDDDTDADNVNNAA